MSDLNKEWEKVQEMAFTSWVNSVLDKRGAGKINEVSKDLSNGVKLIYFLEGVSGKKFTKKIDPDPKTRILSIQNLHLAMIFVDEDLKVKVQGVAAEEFVDCNKKMILGFLWTLYRKYRIAVINEGDKSSEEGLLAWCKKTTDGYKGVNITTFKQSFKDGTGFLALAHKYDTSAFSYDEYESKDQIARLNAAFDFAEKGLGIPKLLEAESLSKGQVDERSIILYTSLFFHAYRAKEEREALEASQNSLQNTLSSLEGALQGEKLSQEELAKQKKDLENTLNELRAQNEARNKKISDIQARIDDALRGIDDERMAKLDLEARLSKTEKDKAILELKLQEMRDEKERLEKKLEEDRKRAAAEQQGLGLLRHHISHQINDIAKWQSFLDNPDAIPYNKAQVNLDAELASLIFEEQAKKLGARVENENIQLGKYLADKEDEIKNAGAPKKRTNRPTNPD
ncbi:cortexillin II [Cavenderia fasciculata]|uniref:Cortexillin II n=1 Tax=Cavenderia fasciculata TaxID=261658 RepID=F4QBP2_CACFS|nr:cortexillin II [Cavenderia fasciculata]EGG14630.1 cortexillin II [Cavenderia fasciculata]|eukprot:XP_004351138.1 cortexillin II [Cavenderia fasciculata]